MLHIRLACAPQRTGKLLDYLGGQDAGAHPQLSRGASLVPPGAPCGEVVWLRRPRRPIDESAAPHATRTRWFRLGRRTP